MSNEEDLPILYVKPGCPWCLDVIKFLDYSGIRYRQHDVSRDHEAYEEMREKSGQTKAPTLDWRGDILADFGVEELIPFLQQRDVKLEYR